MGELQKRRIASKNAPFTEAEKQWALAQILSARKDIVLDPRVQYHVSLLASISTVLFTDQVPYIAVETINAKRDPDHRRIIQWVNPHGIRTLAECDSKEPVHAAVLHENCHIGQDNLALSKYNESMLGDPIWELALETNINGWSLVHKYGRELPAKDGKIIVVDPDSVHRSYVDQCKKEGKTHLSKLHFLRSEFVIYSELSGLQKPAGQRQLANFCGVSHGGGESGGEDESGQGDPSDGGGSWKPAKNDAEVLSEVMERVYAATVKAAEGGDKNAEKDIQELMEEHPEMEKLWSTTGAERLRGRTTKSKKASTMWTRHVKTTIASKLGNGYLWVWNRRTPWEDRFTPRGRMPRKHGAVFIDSSGSMPADLIDRVANLVGKIDGVTVDWHWFDASVGPFVPGGEILGGGGTSFQAIEDHLSGHGRIITAGKGCCKKYPDFVVVLTDGYAPEMQPSRPNRWVWLITPNGDMWPEKAGMSTHQVSV